MKPYIVKNSEFLNFFNKLSPKNKLKIVSSLTRDQINAIGEICKNFLKRNLTQDPTVIKKVKSAKKEIKHPNLKH